MNDKETVKHYMDVVDEMIKFYGASTSLDTLRNNLNARLNYMNNN